MPALPTWDALHPLVIHFPIALLLVAPLFVVLGLVLRKHATALFGAALLLMLLGTIAAFVAVSTGEAASDLAERSAGIEPVLEEHEELAETTRTVFAILTLVFAAMLAAPWLLRRKVPVAATVVANVVFLAMYTGGATLLVRTGHQGGLLVHEYGVRALLPASMLPDQGGASGALSEHEHEDDDD
jgi:uncharacterized membrane protein